MIRRLLVANRGEIAVRVIRACREFGIESVAVYSEADERAPHAKLADRAGRDRTGARDPELPVDPGDSRGGAAVARRRGASRLRVPLRERRGLHSACADAGLTFVGPPADVIARMGSKIEARRLMQRAGVPVVPGETPPINPTKGSGRRSIASAFRSLVKASAGGGGKGMRHVRDAGEIAEAIQGARREASAAFGDGTLYVERLVERPHHVEVQVFGDSHGQVVHLFERECSAAAPPPEGDRRESVAGPDVRRCARG